MHTITLQPIPVLADGGSHEGRLVLSDGQLVAVFTRVTAEETRSGAQNSASGWFLEAGFGPCSPLLAVGPPVFSKLEEVEAWVLETLNAELTAKSR